MNRLKFYEFIFSFVFLMMNSDSANGSDKKEISTPEVYSGKQNQNWEVVQNELIALKAKLDAQHTLVNTLIAEKANVTGEALAAKIEDVKKQHLKYEQLVVEYNKKNEEFLTRYPERGLKVKRLYKRAKLKSIQSFEEELTFGDRLNKLHKKVLTQYPNANHVSSDGSQTSSQDKTKSKNKSVTEQIELKN
jgi:hypothetical protein